MVRALAVVTCGLVLSACWRSSKSATEAPPIENRPSATVAEPPALMTLTERVFAAMARFEHAMCACVDAECAQRVSDEMTKWSQEHAAVEREPIKMTDAEMKRATEMGTHMGECMQTAMGTDP